MVDQFLMTGEEEMEECEGYDEEDYEDYDYGWTDDIDLADYEEPDWCEDWREEEEAEAEGW
ncbi:MAG: hypothetical protein QXL28_00450 [Desulfurococcaceae archaeon]